MGFFSMFPYYFLPEHIPGIIFQTGMIGGENGEVDGQLQYSEKVLVGSYRWTVFREGIGRQLWWTVPVKI